MIFSLLVATIAHLEGGEDARRIKAGKPVEHKFSAFVRACICFVFAFFVPGSLWQLTYEFIAYLAIYWIIFDMTVGHGIGKGVLYVGTTALADKSYHWFTGKIHEIGIRHRKLHFLMRLQAGHVALITKLTILTLFVILRYTL